jgi:hypothetical protein
MSENIQDSKIQGFTAICFFPAQIAVVFSGFFPHFQTQLGQ